MSAFRFSLAVASCIQLPPALASGTGGQIFVGFSRTFRLKPAIFLFHWPSAKARGNLKNFHCQVLTREQLEAYGRDGFLVVENFVSPEACDRLRARAEELVAAFEPETVSVFSTREQTRTSDEYFLSSGDKVRF